MSASQQTPTPHVDMDAELQQYIITALWSSTDEQPDGNGGPPMDDKYGPEDLAPETIETMRAEIADFVAHAPADARAYGIDELGTGQIGHDLWLTRNRHGAGFWDRFAAGTGESFGRELTELAHSYGESYLYAGDDGKVYVA